MDSDAYFRQKLERMEQDERRREEDRLHREAEKAQALIEIRAFFTLLHVAVAGIAALFIVGIWTQADTFPHKCWETGAVASVALMVAVVMRFARLFAEEDL